MNAFGIGRDRFAIVSSIAIALAFVLSPIAAGTTRALAPPGPDDFANALAPTLPYGPVDFSTETATIVDSRRR
jgi:hypothetical protein